MSTAQQNILDAQSQTGEHGTRLMQALLIAAIAASGISMIFSIGTAVVSADQPAPGLVVSHD